MLTITQNMIACRIADRKNRKKKWQKAFLLVKKFTSRKKLPVNRPSMKY